MAAVFQASAVVILLCLHLVTAGRRRSKKEVIYIGGMYPLSGYDGHEYSQSFPYIIEAAFQEINDNPNILSDYELQLVSRDTRGEGGLALFELFNLMQEPYKVPILLGPDRSTVAMATGQTMHHFSMSQLVFSARSSEITRRDTYPNVFVSNFVNTAFNPAKIGIMQQFGWTEAATVTSNNNAHYMETADLHEAMRAAGYPLVSGTVLHTEDSNLQRSAANVLKNLKKSKPSVIFVSLSERMLATFMCEAFKAGIVNQPMLVVSATLMPNDWQLTYAAHTGCTEAQLRQTNNNMMGIDHLYLREDGTPAVSGKTATAFTTWLEGLPIPTGVELPTTSPFAYDAAYAVALALDGAVAALPSGVTLQDFDYDRADIADVIKNQLQSVDFEGVTGPVAFGAEGTRDGTVYVFTTNDDGSHQRLATYDTATGQMTWN